MPSPPPSPARRRKRTKPWRAAAAFAGRGRRRRTETRSLVASMQSCGKRSPLKNRQIMGGGGQRDNGDRRLINRPDFAAVGLRPASIAALLSEEVAVEPAVPVLPFRPADL